MPVADELDVLLETLFATDGPRPRADALTLLCEKSVDLIGCDQAIIRLVDDARTALREAALWSRQPLAQRHRDLLRDETLAIGDLSSSIVGPGRLSPSLEAFRTGDIQTVATTESSDEFLPAAMCAAPLIRRGTAIGVLSLYWLHPHRPSAGELAGIRTIARHAAFAIDASTRFEALSSAVGAAGAERDAATEAARSATAIAEFQERVLDLLDAEAPIADDVLALLAAAGVRSPAYRPVDGDSCEGVAVAAGGTLFGALTWDVEDAPPDERMLHAAARAIAWVLAGRERERRLTAARHRALATLVHADASPAAVHEAESVLGLDESERSTLLVGAFADADAAFACVRALGLDLADGGQGAATAVASDTRAIVLCRATGDVSRLGARLRTAPGYGGAGTSGAIGPGGWQRALRDASTAARVSHTRGGRVVASDAIGPLAALAADVSLSAAGALVDDALGAVEAYDRAHDSRLVDTLAAYLSHSGSLQEAAEQLHVHVNTVKQRLARIEQLIGADVRDYGVAARLLLALEWRSVLRDD